MTPVSVDFKVNSFGRCGVCKEFKKVMRLEYDFVDCICRKCAKAYRDERRKNGEPAYFVFMEEILSIPVKERRKMEKKKKYKVHVPYINKDFIVDDWTGSMAVDLVLETKLTPEETAILNKHIWIDCEVNEVFPEELD